MELAARPRPSSFFKRPTSKGKWGERGKEEGMGEEGMGKKWEGRAPWLKFLDPPLIYFRSLPLTALTKLMNGKDHLILHILLLDF